MSMHNDKQRSKLPKKVADRNGVKPYIVLFIFDMNDKPYPTTHTLLTKLTV